MVIHDRNGGAHQPSFRGCSGPFLGTFPLRDYARRQKHSESRLSGNGENDPNRSWAWAWHCGAAFQSASHAMTLWTCFRTLAHSIPILAERCHAAFGSTHSRSIAVAMLGRPAKTKVWLLRTVRGRDDQEELRPHRGRPRPAGSPETGVTACNGSNVTMTIPAT